MAQLVLGVAGAYIGSFFGQPALGYAIGSAIGASFTKLPDIKGPRLSDLRVQFSTFGLPILQTFGTVRVAGNIIWSSGLIEHENTEEVGGKGGPSQEQTTYSYTASFAIGICEGPIIGVRKIWADGKLIFDISEDADINTIAVSGVVNARKFLYIGDDTQLPDSNIEGFVGVGNTPAYRGLAYMVFDDIPLAKFGNRIPNYEFEVVSAGVTGVVDDTEYSNEVLYEWVEGARDPRNCKNDHLYEGEYGGGGERSELADAIADEADVMGYSIEDTVVAWSGVAPYQGQEYDLGINPGERVLINVHVNHYAPAEYVGRLSGAVVSTIGPCELPDFPLGELKWWANLTNLGVQAINYPNWAFRTGVVQTLECQISPNVCFSPGPTPGAGFTRPLANGGQCFSGPVVVSATWMFQDELIATQRVPRAPDNPCHPRCEASEPPLPENPDYCVIGTTITRDLDWSLHSVTYKVLQKYETSGGLVTRYPLSPARPTGHAQYTDEDFWTDAYNAAVLSGDMPGGMTYSASGAGGVNTYPRTQAYGYRRQFSHDTLEPQPVPLSTIVAALCVRSELTADRFDVTPLTPLVKGYVLNAVGLSGRDGIQGLIPAFNFDGVESDGLIKFNLRGSAPVVEVLEDECDARPYGAAPNAPVPLTRAQELELPRRVRVQYMNVNNAYQIGQQYAGRNITRAQDILDIPMSVVLDDDEAAQAADRILYELWIGRNRYELSLTRKFTYLDPTDNITVLKNDGTRYTINLRESDWQGGLTRFRGIAMDAATYVSAVIGGGSEGGGGVDPLEGPTITEFLDLPAIRDEDSSPGWYGGFYGPLDGWGGATVQRSGDGGSSFQSILTAEIEMTFGVCSDILPVALPALFDRGSVLTVVLTNGTLSSCTDEQLDQGANVCAVGIDGRWEVLQFRDATLIAPNTYELSWFIRGRRGTEWAIETHEADDTFVLLSTTSVWHYDSTLAHIGVPAIFRSVTFGTPAQGSAQFDFTPEGVALEPYSPVWIEATVATETDCVITWIRRNRLNNGWLNNIGLPLSEASESYEIDILDDTETVVRTLTSTTPTVTYTAAEQMTDFGSGPHDITIKVYQMSADVGRGYPGTSDTVTIG